MMCQKNYRDYIRIVSKSDLINPTTFLKSANGELACPLKNDDIISH